MTDDNHLAQATQPFSFHDFLERMKEPNAADLVRNIKNFIKAFEERKPDSDVDSQAVQDFLAGMENSFRVHPAWANTSADVQSQAVEALEKYLMTKLYHKTFATSALDRERDAALAQRMAALGFVRPEHLDIPEAFRNEDSWLLARRELLKMNNYKAPRDKLVCLLNCCRVVNNLLHVGAANANDARGADDFLPILIYIVIHANPPQLASNLEYIQRYRMASRMMSEAAYFFTQLYSAASFIETINAGSLTIDPDEFLAHMMAAGVVDLAAPDTQGWAQQPAGGGKGGALAAAAVAAAGVPRAREAPPNRVLTLTGVDPDGPMQLADSDCALPMPQPASHDAARSVPTAPAPPPPPPVFPSAAELEHEGVASLTALEAAGQLRDRHRFMYATAADLTLGEVALLLEDYKKLVLHYESLAAAVAARRAASLVAPPAIGPAMAPAAPQQPRVLPAVPVPVPVPALSATSSNVDAMSDGGLSASEGADGERRGAAMLKMLNPFSRVQRSFKGTLSMLDTALAGRSGASAPQASPPGHAAPPMALSPTSVPAMAAAAGTVSVAAGAGSASYLSPTQRHYGATAQPRAESPYAAPPAPVPGGEASGEAPTANAAFESVAVPCDASAAMHGEEGEHGGFTESAAEPSSAAEGGGLAAVAADVVAADLTAGRDPAEGGGGAAVGSMGMYDDDALAGASAAADLAPHSGEDAVAAAAEEAGGTAGSNDAPSFIGLDVASESEKHLLDGVADSLGGWAGSEPQAAESLLDAGGGPATGAEHGAGGTGLENGGDAGAALDMDVDLASLQPDSLAGGDALSTSPDCKQPVPDLPESLL